jgi:hypothetical protein
MSIYSRLQSVASLLTTRKSALASNLVNKGVAATSTENLSVLISKVNNISSINQDFKLYAYTVSVSRFTGSAWGISSNLSLLNSVGLPFPMSRLWGWALLLPGKLYREMHCNGYML